ncbi:MAG: acyltransferase [Alphaproteobacteria bacterium]|nr:MAG: acyltransferase [Alphaproteobacteria bacterium]
MIGAWIGSSLKPLRIRNIRRFSFVGSFQASWIAGAELAKQGEAKHRRVDFLDALRLIAAGAVLFQHVFEGRNAALDAIVDLTSPGVFGVVLFFFISGFVMPMTSERGFSLPRFATKRVLRIYPLLLLAFLFIAVLNGATGGAFFPAAFTTSPKFWLANIFLIQDYVRAPAVLNVTWTLSLEFAWYALFAAMMHFRGHPNIQTLIRAAPIVLLVLTAASVLAHFRMPFGRVGMIYAAIFGARAYQLLRGQIETRDFLRDALIFEAVTLISNGVAFGYFRHPNITLWQAIMPWTLALIVFTTVCSVQSIRQSRLLNAEVLLFGGRISYSLYLLHPIALRIADLLLGRANALLVGIVLAFVMAAAGYFLVERPGQDFANWVTRKGALPKVAADAVGTSCEPGPPLRP